MFKRTLVVLAVVALFASMLILSANATDGTLYTQGNLEWSLDASTGVVTAHITEAATNGVIHFEDYKDGEWKTFTKDNGNVITKIVIENVEGRQVITKVTGGFNGAKLETIVFPKTVESIGQREGGWGFTSKAIKTIGPEGTPEGTCDLSSITQGWSDYHYKNFFTNVACSTFILPNISAYIVPQMFNSASGFKEITIPENITAIKAAGFNNCLRLKKITITSAKTVVDEKAFKDCSQFYTIVGHKDSTAYTCAQKNGYEFVDINTGEVILEGTIELGIDPDTVFPWKWEDGDAKGNLYAEYNGNRNVNTNWAWYEAEKTLVFFDNKPGSWNETGAQSAVSEGDGHWMDYADKIEKIAVGPEIDKISSGAFKDLPNLKYVQIDGPYQIDGNAFLNCTSLVSVYRAYTNPQEGVADLTSISTINSGILRNTGIETVILKNDISAVNATAFYGCKNIIS
ncbi:MAG: hypothetical protein E7671_05260, partial [Ruminococcaceae bacterium]|nr:hypothetical protein [Oscillospiraceae bacterium]